MTVTTACFGHSVERCASCRGVLRSGAVWLFAMGLTSISKTEEGDGFSTIEREKGGAECGRIAHPELTSNSISRPLA